MFLALFSLCLSAQSVSSDSIAATPIVVTTESTSIRPYVGAELGVASMLYSEEELRGYLNMGLYGNRNSLGLMVAFQSDRMESKTDAKVGNKPAQTTSESWDDFDLLTLGLDYRHFFRPVGDPKHAPFVSATVARTFYFYRNSYGSEPDYTRTAFGLALGEEVPVGALFLFGKVGARCHVMVDKFESFQFESNTTYNSRTSRVITSLNVSLGMNYRF
jgi:hypothetical protein